jgi:hypothetical protein
MGWELKSNARWRPTPKPNAVKYKVPLTTKASGRLIHLARRARGDQKSKPAAGARQPGKQVGRRRTMYMMVVTFHRLTRSPIDIDAKFRSIIYRQHLL